MKIIYNNLIPFPGFSAMMFFGVIFARKKYKPISETTIRHGGIHEVQAKECGGYLIYYAMYLAFWVRYGYRKIPFEREAFDWERVPGYLDIRDANKWRYYK